MERVTKLKRRNLLGETPDQEKSRYRKVARLDFRKTNNPTSYLSLPYTAGATKFQIDRRDKILKDEGLKRKPIMTIRQRKRFL
jgi:hypothetical protein